MSISFRSYDTGQTFLIGGQGSLGGATSGNIGPSPRYSINREDISTGDGTYLGSKFNINITGTAVLGTYLHTDLDTKGKRQEDIQALVLKNLHLNRESRATGAYGVGKLEISPYGGLPNQIIFNDAKLLSIEIAQQTEENPGIQYVEYTFTFEAYEDGSTSNNSEWGLTKQGPTWKLSSSEESWDLQPNDGQFTFDGVNLDSGDMYKTYTLTHTLAAVGLRKFNSSTEDLDIDNGHAWRQAAGWVNDRIQAAGDINPDQAITEDVVKNTSEISAQFHPFYMNKDSTTNMVDLKTKQYKARNKTRVINSDIANGSYSVTDSWIVSLDQIKALHEINISIDNSNDSAAVVVTVDGTVTGLTEKDINDNIEDKYTNALEEYKKFFVGADNALASKIGAAAQTVYDAFVAAGYKTDTLREIAVSHQETHNKTSGTISWSSSFNDEEILVNGAISQNVQFSYTNTNGVYNKYQVISPSVVETIRNGPFIYNSNYTPEKILKISVDLVMSFDNRISKPDGRSAFTLPEFVKRSEALDENYSDPEYRIIYDYAAPRLTAKTESWNPKTGAYNLSIEYTYV